MLVEIIKSIEKKRNTFYTVKNYLDRGWTFKGLKELNTERLKNGYPELTALKRLKETCI